MLKEQGFQWQPVIWGAILIFVLSNLLVSALPAIYGTVIGFQTRGDMELVNAGVNSLIQSVWFATYFYLVLAGISLWRGFALAKKVHERVNLHAAATGAIAVVLPLILAFAAGDGLTLVEWGLQIVAIMAGLYVGVYLPQRKSPAAAVQ